MQDFIRVSVGTAAVLGLMKCKLDAAPTTAYVMTFSPNRCTANCGFCAQAKKSTANADHLSRISWPTFPLSQFLTAISTNYTSHSFHRLCIQTLCYPNLKRDLIKLVTVCRHTFPSLPLSIALPPLSESFLRQLKELGVDRVAISLDAATPELFESIKGSGVDGSFSWQQHQKALDYALAVFGFNHTSTHLIIGLGETEEEAVKLLQDLSGRGVTIGLFPFTPIPGTLLEYSSRPPLEVYRRIQLAYYLIRNELSHIEQMVFKNGHLVSFGLTKDELSTILETGKAFQTTGCPSCNRPFFTEKPGGPLYNYPLLPTTESLNEIRQQLEGVE